MKKINKKLLLFLVVSFLFISSITVLAKTKLVNLQVSYKDIKIVVDGKEVAFGKGTDGKVAEPFIHEGTTYLPVRSVSEALGKEVQWDANTNTVYIGQGAKTDKADKTNKYLVETVAYYDQEGFTTIKPGSNQTLNLGGIEYNNGYRVFLGGGDVNIQYANFNFEGKYSVLTGKVGLNTESKPVIVKFMSNGKVLDQMEIIGGELPKDFSININGISNFRIEIYGGTVADRVGLTDLIIK